MGDDGNVTERNWPHDLEDGDVSEGKGAGVNVVINRNFRLGGFLLKSVGIDEDKFDSFLQGGESKSGGTGFKVHEFGLPSLQKKTKFVRSSPSPRVIPTVEFQGLDFDRPEDENGQSLGLEKPLPDESISRKDGVVFKKGECYGLEGGRLGILYFLPGQRAMCIRVAEWSKTRFEEIADQCYRTERGRQHEKPKSVGDFVQWRGSETVVDLGDLQPMAERMNLPVWSYEQKSTGHYFGFINTSKKPMRLGLRAGPPRGMDFYAGAGLMSSGIESSGCKITVAVEKDPDAAESYKSTHSNCKIVKEKDLKEEMTKEDMEKWPQSQFQTVIFSGDIEVFLKKVKHDAVFRNHLNKVHFAHLSPPCQGFSKDNRNKAGNVSGNNRLSLHILAVVGLFRPLVVSFENVVGMWETAGIRDYIHPIVYRLLGKGYNVRAGKLKSCDYGDPQKRDRFILLASAAGIPLPPFPNKTHSQPSTDGCTGFDRGTLPYINARDALGPYEGTFPTRTEPYTNQDQRDCPDEPAGAVKASKRKLHYADNRYYDSSEAALLMGQNPSVIGKLKGSSKKKQRQIGNGVPMGMASALYRCVYEVLRFVWKGEEDALNELDVWLGDASGEPYEPEANDEAPSELD